MPCMSQPMRRCDLLSNSYLCVSNNSLVRILALEQGVVICFQIPIFALAITVDYRIENQKDGCDLLSNSYLCVSNNSCTTLLVVRCQL